MAFPETEANGGHYYANPWPLSEDYFLVGWADQKLPPHCRATDEQNPRNAMGLYLLDAFGNQELLYRDPDISSVSPMPLAPRPQPPTQSAVAAANSAPESQVLVQDVYYGLDGVPRGSVKRLRLVAVVPKVQPQMNNPVLGISAEDPGKFVLGTVPVEPDGSAYFRVPSGLPLFFQALDVSGAAVQTMRTLTYAMPGQTLACAGCHEHRDSAPPTGKSALAVLRPPSKPTPGPTGSWPLRFDQLVQPVLDRHCLECHRSGGNDVQAAKLDLASTNSYQALLAFGDADLKQQAFERDRSNPNQAVAANSKLWKLLTQPAGHQNVKLDADSLDRLATWMDTYAQRLGSFSEQQERELLAFRQALSPLLSEPSDLSPAVNRPPKTRSSLPSPDSNHPPCPGPAKQFQPASARGHSCPQQHPNASRLRKHLWPANHSTLLRTRMSARRLGSGSASHSLPSTPARTLSRSYAVVGERARPGRRDWRPRQSPSRLPERTHCSVTRRATEPPGEGAGWQRPGRACSPFPTAWTRLSRALGLAAIRNGLILLLPAGTAAGAATLLDQFRAGPMSGVNDIIFAARKINESDGHWYANIGYYAHDPNRKAWREGTKLYRWNAGHRQPHHPAR